jgi:simple sugar transport system substrate-binding protein
MIRKTRVAVLLLLALLLVGGVVASAQDAFVFGVVLVGPKNDRGWSQSHYEAGQYVEQHVPGSKMVLFESLNTSDNPQATLHGVVSDMVDQGAKLIITTSAEFQEDTDKVAKEFPNVVFMHMTGDSVLKKTAPPNVGNYNSWFEMGRAISGCAAALTTKTGSIGYVGALIDPETRRHASSAYLGARYCYQKYAGGDPDKLKFTVTWIGFWFNIPGVTLDPTEVSTTFFDGGADVVLSGIDTTEALIVADKFTKEGKPVWAIPTDNPKGCDEAPDVCLGAPYYNWGPTYVRLVKEIQSGTWKQSWDWEPPVYDDLNNLDKSPVGFTFGAGLTDDAKKKLESFLSDMAAYGDDPANKDTMFLWSGPLNLQDSTVLAKDGEKLELTKIWYLEQLLQGMTGASTSE